MNEILEDGKRNSIRAQKQEMTKETGTQRIVEIIFMIIKRGEYINLHMDVFVAELQGF